VEKENIIQQKKKWRGEGCWKTEIGKENENTNGEKKVFPFAEFFFSFP
jgi:hypothetical protein